MQTLSYDPAVWHEMSETLYYRYSPDLLKLWWAAYQEDILLGVGWYWFITDVRGLTGAEYHHSYRFDTWQEAASNCEEYYANPK